MCSWNAWHSFHFGCCFSEENKCWEYITEILKVPWLRTVVPRKIMKYANSFQNVAFQSKEIFSALTKLCPFTHMTTFNHTRSTLMFCYMRSLIRLILSSPPSFDSTHYAAVKSWQFLPLPRGSPPFRDFHLWVHDPFFFLWISALQQHHSQEKLTLLILKGQTDMSAEQTQSFKAKTAHSALRFQNFNKQTNNKNT